MRQIKEKNMRTVQEEPETFSGGADSSTEASEVLEMVDAQLKAFGIEIVMSNNEDVYAWRISKIVETA
jgi:hypothetical protein